MVTDSNPDDDDEDEDEEEHLFAVRPGLSPVEAAVVPVGSIVFVVKGTVEDTLEWTSTAEHIRT